MPVTCDAPERPGEDKISTKNPRSSDEDNAISNDTIRRIDVLPITSVNEQLNVNIVTNTTSKKVLSINLLIIPFTFFNVLGLNSLMSIRTSLFMEKACQTTLKYPREICRNLSAYETQLNAVQIVANDYSLYVTLIIMVPTAIISIIFGGWSNEYIRKCRVLIALFGLISIDVGFILNSIYIEWPLFYVLIVCVPGSLLGGIPIITTYIYTFICEKFSLESRTLLYACLKMVMSLGGLCASFFSGQLFKYFGCEAVLGLAMASHTLCFLYILLITKTSQSFGEQRFKMLIIELFSFSTFLENFRAFTKMRENNGRLQIILLTVATAIVVCIEGLPGDVLFLFCNKTFSWNFTTYSNITVISMIAAIIVTLILTPICTKLLSVKDSVIGIVGTLALLIQCLLYGLSFKEWIFYLGMAIGSFGGFSLFAILARLSKIVAVSEAGQVFAIVSSTESVSPLLEALLATRIYNATINIYPGFTLIFMAMLLFFPLALFIWTFPKERKNDEETQRKDSLATSLVITEPRCKLYLINQFL